MYILFFHAEKAKKRDGQMYVCTCPSRFVLTAGASREIRKKVRKLVYHSLRTEVFATTRNDGSFYFIFAGQVCFKCPMLS